MKKPFNLRNLNLLLIITIVSLFSIISVNATITWNNNTNSVTVTREVTGVTNPVTNTFTYTITADSNNPAGASGAPTTASIAMSNQSVSSNTATLSTTIDFSGMSFTKPGRYKYTITETASTNASRYPLDSHTYTVQIQVLNTNTTTPNGTDFTAHITTWNDAATPVKVNTADFTSASPQSQYGHLELTKSVTGTGADANKHYIIGVKILDDGTFTVTGLDAVVDNHTNPTTIVGNASDYTYVRIKPGQVATIGVTTIDANNSLDEIPVGTRMAFNESSTETSTNGYTPYYSINGATRVAGKSKTNVYSIVGTNTFEYINEKNIPTPETGLFITIIPYIILIAVISAGIITFMKFKNKKSTINEKEEII